MEQWITKWKGPVILPIFNVKTKDLRGVIMKTGLRRKRGLFNFSRLPRCALSLRAWQVFLHAANAFLRPISGDWQALQ